MSSTIEAVTIAVEGAVHVSGLLERPPQPRACFVLAHGAGAGMTHPFMSAMANELGAHAVATLLASYTGYQGEKRHAILAPLLVMAVPLYDLVTVLAIRHQKEAGF